MSVNTFAAAHGLQHPLQTPPPPPTFHTLSIAPSLNRSTSKVPHPAIKAKKSPKALQAPPLQARLASSKRKRGNEDVDLWTYIESGVSRAESVDFSDDKVERGLVGETFTSEVAGNAKGTSNGKGRGRISAMGLNGKGREEKDASVIPPKMDGNGKIYRKVKEEPKAAWEEVLGVVGVARCGDKGFDCGKAFFLTCLDGE